MKIHHSPRAAFFNLRPLVATLLCLTAGTLTLFAFVAIAQQRDDKQQSNSSAWVARLASTLGIDASQRSGAATAAAAGGHDAANTSGGAIKIDKDRPEQLQRPPQTAPLIPPYSGPPRDLRPVKAVRSGKLRYMPPIDPATVPKRAYVEPTRPKPPTQNLGPEGPVQ